MLQLIQQSSSVGMVVEAIKNMSCKLKSVVIYMKFLSNLLRLRNIGIIKLAGSFLKIMFPNS